MVHLLLAGPSGVGKSTVAEELARKRSLRLVRVREVIAELSGVTNPSRSVLQQMGMDLDLSTNGQWLATYIGSREGSGAAVVVDSVRSQKQTRALLDLNQEFRLIYLTAGWETRLQRFALSSQSDQVKASMPLSEASRHESESEVEGLMSWADLVIPTDNMSAAQVVDLIHEGVVPAP